MKNKNLSFRMGYVLPIIGASLLAGCATYLESRHISTITNNPPKGILYSLPMLQYQLDVTRQLSKCKPEAEVQTIVDVKEVFIPDPNYTFELDFTELSGITNTSEIEAEFYDNGTLKSINLEADDRSAEILTNTFKIISSTALAVVAAPAVIGQEPEKKPLCNQDSEGALKKIKDSEDDLKKLTKKVEKASEEVARLNLIVSGADKPSEQILQDLQKEVKILKQHKQALVNLNKTRAPFLARIQYKEKHLWPKSTENDVMKTHFLPSSDLKNRWFEKDENNKIIGDKTIDSKLALYLQINQLVQKIPSTKLDDKNKERKGLFYRYPMPIELEVCTDAPCDDHQARNIVKTIRSKTPQHGPLVLLPFENGAFQNNRLEVTFSPSGLPSKLVFKNQRSAGEAVSGATAGIVEQLPALRQQLLSADLEKLKRETALLEQEKALLEAEQSLEPSPTADLEAQTALIKSQTDLLNAKIALEEAQRKLDEVK